MASLTARQYFQLCAVRIPDQSIKVNVVFISINKGSALKFMHKGLRLTVVSIAFTLILGCDVFHHVILSDYADCSGVDLPLLEPSPSENSSKSWVIMGSSSAAGAGAGSYAVSWAGRLESYLEKQGITLHNIAHGGDVTYQALSTACEVSFLREKPRAGHNIDTALMYLPEAVVISYPSNDAAVGYSAKETVSNVLMLTKQFRQYGVDVIVLSGQPRPLSSSKTNTLLEVDVILATHSELCFVDVYSKLAASNNTLKPEYDYDSVHMNSAGHEKVFDALINTIKSGSCLDTTTSR